MNNRVPVTIRLNLDEQQNMIALMKFWKLNEKQVAKFALEQLVISTRQLSKKLTEDKPDVHNSGPSPTGVGDTQSTGNSGGTSGGADETTAPVSASAGGN